MLYQNIKELILQKNKITTDTIFLSINKKEESIEDVVADLVSLYIEFKTNDNVEKVIAQSFYILFEQGLTWEKLLEFNLYTNISRNEKKPLIKLKFLSLKGFTEKSFHDYFFNDINIDSLKMKKIAYQAFSLGLLKDEEIKIIWNTYKLDTNKQNLNQFLLSCHHIDEMKKIDSLFGLTPWTVVTKEDNSETLWLSNVFQMNKLFKQSRNGKFVSFFDIKEILTDGKNIWKNISTDKTTNIDFQSKILFSTCSIPKEQYLSSLIKTLELKYVNLNCVDFFDKETNKMTLQNKLLKEGKIRTLNQLNKNQKIEVDFNKVLISVPNKPDLITNKQAFLKNWLKSKDKIEDYSDMLSAVLKTNNRQYVNSEMNIKCYFPIKPENLDNSKDDWVKSQNGEWDFLKLNDSKANVSLKCFSNLLRWLNKKEIDFKKPFNESLNVLDALIITSLQLPINSSLEHNVLVQIINKNFNNLNDFDKKNTLTKIKDNWTKIWTSEHQSSHEYKILTTEYKQQSNLFVIINSLLDSCLTNNVKLGSDFFDNQWNEIISIFKTYGKEDLIADKIVKQFNVLELDANLTHNTVKQKVKKI